MCLLLMTSRKAEKSCRNSLIPLDSIFNLLIPGSLR